MIVPLGSTGTLIVGFIRNLFESSSNQNSLHKPMKLATNISLFKNHLIDIERFISKTHWTVENFNAIVHCDTFNAC